jgi:hypothetical protein
MLAELSFREFEDWIAAYDADPWGEERADMRMARLVWATLQPYSKRKLNENKYRFSFSPKQRPTPAEYKQKSMRAYTMHANYMDRSKSR